VKEIAYELDRGSETIRITLKRMRKAHKVNQFVDKTWGNNVGLTQIEEIRLVPREFSQTRQNPHSFQTRGVRQREASAEIC